MSMYLYLYTVEDYCINYFGRWNIFFWGEQDEESKKQTYNTRHKEKEAVLKSTLFLTQLRFPEVAINISSYAIQFYIAPNSNLNTFIFITE